MRKILILFLTIGSIASLTAQDIWTIDKGHSNIIFTVTHMVVSEVDGEFMDFEGTITGGDENFNGSMVEFSAKTNSVNTGNTKRDAHLQSDDFFNSEAFPNITFKGKLVKEGTQYFLLGNFTMRDVTKEVRFPVKYNGKIDTGRGIVAGFKVTGTLNRFDYGLKWNSAIEAGSLVVAEDVELTCKIELRQKK